MKQCSNAFAKFDGWDTNVTAAIPVTRFGRKVLAHSANSIAVLKGTLDDGIKFNSKAKNPINYVGMASILREVF